MSASETHEESEGKATVLITSGFLVFIGFVVLGALMYFSWRLGWSLGTWWLDRYAYATLHIAAELASAGLVGWAAVITVRRGWRWLLRSWVALGFAVVFASISILNTYGFMSPRMAAVAGHSAVLETQTGYAEWLKNQTVNPEVADAFAAAAAECSTGRGPQCLAKEARAKYLASQQGNMGAKLEEQFKQLEKTASTTPDTHARAVADITGLSEAASAKLIILTMAGFGQFVKFVCMFFGFKGLGGIIWRRRQVSEADTKTQGGSGGNSGDNVTPLHPTKAATPALPPLPQSVAQPATKQCSGLPVATAPPFLAADVAETVARMRASGMTWRSIGSELGRDHTVLFRQFHGGNKAAKRRNGSLGAMQHRNNGAPQQIYA